MTSFILKKHAFYLNINPTKFPCAFIIYFNHTNNTREKYTYTIRSSTGNCVNYFWPYYQNKKLQRSIKYQGPKT